MTISINVKLISFRIIFFVEILVKIIVERREKETYKCTFFYRVCNVKAQIIHLKKFVIFIGCWGTLGSVSDAHKKLKINNDEKFPLVTKEEMRIAPLKDCNDKSWDRKHAHIMY